MRGTTRRVSGRIGKAVVGGGLSIKHPLIKSSISVIRLSLFPFFLKFSEVLKESSVATVGAGCYILREGHLSQRFYFYRSSVQITRIDIIMYEKVRFVNGTRKFQQKIYCLSRSYEEGWSVAPGMVSRDLLIYTRIQVSAVFPFFLSGVSTLGTSPS